MFITFAHILKTADDTLAAAWTPAREQMTGCPAANDSFPSLAERCMR